jgi:HK97 family phage major capsid protein
VKRPRDTGTFHAKIVLEPLPLRCLSGRPAGPFCLDNPLRFLRADGHKKPQSRSVRMDQELRDALGSINTTVAGFAEKAANLQRQLDAMVLEQKRPGAPGSGGNTIDTVIKAITEDPGFAALQKSGRGRAVITVPNLLELKSTLTSGSVVPYDAEPGVSASGRKRYRLRELIPSRPIETGSAFFVRETAFADNASPQVSEGSTKQESSFTLTGDTATVATIAHYSTVSRQIFDDLTELGLHISTSLVHGLEREFEEELLTGSGTSGQMEGLITTATAFDTTLLVPASGWQYVDILRTAALQLEEAGYDCTGFVVSPRVWARIEMSKTSYGEYINGSPTGAAMREFLWTRTIVPSPSIGALQFLAGDFASGCHIRMRHDSVIDMSDSHDLNFTKNLLTLRAEMRAALVKNKPGAFVTGSLTTSP